MLQCNQFDFDAKVWRWIGDLPAGKASAAWYFVSLPKELSEYIIKMFGDQKKGWRSFPVIVTIGATSWTTSIFPDKRGATYVLPLKATVRKKENISVDQTIKVMTELNV